MSNARPNPRGTQSSADLVGRYELVGPPDAGLLHLDWRGAFLQVSGAREGIGMAFSGRLVIAFAPPTPPGQLNIGDRVEIGAYDIREGEAHGLWVPPAAGHADYSACGTEISAIDPADPHTWLIRRATSIDGSAYAGRVTRTPLASQSGSNPIAVNMKWDLEDGQFLSFALDYGDAVYSTYCLEPNQPHGVAVYEIAGSEFRGTSLSAGASRATSESLVRRRSQGAF